MNGCYNAICSLVMLKRRTVQRVKAFSDVIDVIRHQYIGLFPIEWTIILLYSHVLVGVQNIYFLLENK